MRKIVSLIEQSGENEEAILITGLDGKYAGEKTLFIDGKPKYETDNAECLAEKYKDINSKGIYSDEEGSAFVERFGMSPRLIVCGAGTVGQEVIKLGKFLGLAVIVLEDRREFADKAKELGADEVYTMEFDEGLKNLSEKSADYYVVVTREHKYDKVCLRNILDKNPAYVGMMASKKRATQLKEELKEEGKSEALVSDIHSPIGLNINSETPAEIAVSILAEIIELKNGSNKSGGFNKDILKEILDSPINEKLILATIVKRTGSAPRDVGTKMLIRENGSIKGSVGGGWIEAEVLNIAKAMFESGITHRMYETDKDSENAVLCGGYETIYLEMI